MKIFPVLSGVALVLQLAQLVVGDATIDFNRALTVSYADRDATHGVSFSVSDDKLPSASLLAALSDSYHQPKHQCFSKKTENGPSTVLIAISKCLEPDELIAIRDWVLQITKNTKPYNFNEYEHGELSFEVAAVPGDCKEAALNKVADHVGSDLGPSTTALMSADVDANDLARFETHFGGVGRVLVGGLEPAKKDVVFKPKPSVSKQDADKPLAVLSVVDNLKSYEEVELFERTFKISNVINFSLCKNGKDRCNKFESTLVLREAIDIYIYNPFSITRQLDCGSTLQGGVPVSYVDNANKRQCFCSCPAGTTEESSAYGHPTCKTVTPDVCPCIWSTCPEGYKVTIKDAKKAEDAYGHCAISKLVTQWEVPVPFPSDNYVADERNNSDDRAYVKLTSTKLDDSAVVSGSGQFPWKVYQSDHDVLVDALTYHSYGTYNLSLYAKDYSDHATCEGCVAIVDNVRPKHTNACPLALVDQYDKDAAVPLSTLSLGQVDDLIEEFYKFSSEGVTNDACSGTNNRCDANAFHQMDFFEETYTNKTDDFSSAAEFFDLKPTIDAFVTNAKAKTNPLLKPGSQIEADDCAEPVPPDQCTRCVDLSTTLKEWWTDYKCTTNPATETPQCDGADYCSFKQCLTLSGDTFADATATIKSEASAATQKIIEKLEIDGYNNHSQIHRSVQCDSLHTASNLTCDYKVVMSTLFDIAATPGFELDANVDIDDFVFWRYKLQGGAWKLWTTSEVETFTSAKTNVYIEAWTQCGIVRKFVFAVHLHPHGDVNVCKYFDNMWYQTTVSRVPISSSICTYPQSDFAELTFDYRPNIGLIDYIDGIDRDKLRMHIANVNCTLAFDDHTGAEILHVTQDSVDIIKRFAVEAIHNPKTAESTKFTIACDFAYNQVDNYSVLKTCEKKFELTDCSKPTIDDPPNGDAECTFDNCAGVNDSAGPYEACGGVVVTTASEATDQDGYVTAAQTTTVTGADRACCDSCKDVPLTCEAILDLPDESADDNSDTIKRCEPPPTVQPAYPAYDSAYGSSPSAYDSHNAYGSYATNALLSAGHALVTAGHDHVGVTALLGASALVALVALVVVQRRRRSDDAADANDAYYPLLH